MLYLLEIENFYSIKHAQTIDLRARQDIDSDRLAPIGPDSLIRVPKVVALFGANASGKSNVLRAISFLSWFVAHSFRLPPDGVLPFSRFSDDESQKKPARLAIEFTGPTDPRRIGQPDSQFSRYRYEVIFSAQKKKSVQVTSEELKYWPLGSKKPAILFDRDSSSKVTGGEIFGLTDFRSSLEKILRSNVSVISTLGQLQHPIATVLWRAASLIQTNIFVEKHEFSENLLAQMCHAEPKMLRALNKEIERVDFGIRELSIEETLNGPVIVGHHSGLNSTLPLSAESHGTRQFIKLYPLIALALQTGGLAIIDELDLAIHPLMLKEIFRWFYDPKRNKTDAQLWTTGQNPSLLEELTKEEIFFCEKNTRGQTSVYGLYDIESVRRSDNFYRKYLGGAYGAVPHIG